MELDRIYQEGVEKYKENKNNLSPHTVLVTGFKTRTLSLFLCVSITIMLSFAFDILLL